MCGRYTLTSKKEKLEQRFGISFGFEWAPFYNAVPSQELPVILNESPDEGRKAVWGFLPSWADKNADIQPMINVRAESIAEKPSFREAYRKRRCLIPADGFYEWKKEGKYKTPYYIHLAGNEPFAFAGIWENRVDKKSGEVIARFAVLTTAANVVMSPIYHRMPVILKPEMEKIWLSLAPLPSEILEKFVLPYDKDMRAYPVSNTVNSPEVNSPECIKKVVEKNLQGYLQLFP